MCGAHFPIRKRFVCTRFRKACRLVKRDYPAVGVNPSLGHSGFTCKNPDIIQFTKGVCCDTIFIIRGYTGGNKLCDDLLHKLKGGVLHLEALACLPS